MSACEGYACPPEHSTPAGEVEVHATQSEPLPATGGDLAQGLSFLGLAAALLVAGVFLMIKELRS